VICVFFFGVLIGGGLIFYVMVDLIDDLETARRAAVQQMCKRQQLIHRSRVIHTMSRN